MKSKNIGLIAMMLGSILLLATVPVSAADQIITDPIGDVSKLDFNYETTLVTSSPYININNIDIVQATYTKQNALVTLTLKVHGVIEDRGKSMDDIDDLDNFNVNMVTYSLTLITSDQQYIIEYINKTCQLSFGTEIVNLTASDYSVVGNTLTVSFSLNSPEEEYVELNVQTMFMKFNTSILLDPDMVEDVDEMFIVLIDLAPNPPLTVQDLFVTNIADVGETVQFNASVDTTTGQPPYSYQWDFGDQSTSTLQNPTHVYTKAGTFTYTFTITDNAGDTDSLSGTILISGESGNGDNGGLFSGQMTLFLAAILIIIIIGVVIIIWIIRR